jgi:hypothetical protein
MKKLILAMALLLTGLGLSACKFESMGMFDNNCSGNGGMWYDEHCQYFGKPGTAGW